MAQDSWRRVAGAQAGLVTRAQLNQVGVDRWAVRHRVSTGRWIALTPTVIATVTGELTREQQMWLGVLHGGPQALIGDVAAAEVAGLRNWHRDDITVLIPHGADVGAGCPGIQFRWVRRPLEELQRPGRGVPACRVEPAVLLFAARQRSDRTAEGVLAAVVQQRLTTPDRLLGWIDRLRPLRGAARFRRALEEIAGGAQSVSELDVHRKRALTAVHRTVVRCTSRELRDDPERVALDLQGLGVGLAGSG